MSENIDISGTLSGTLIGDDGNKNVSISLSIPVSASVVITSDIAPTIYAMSADPDALGGSVSTPSTLTAGTVLTTISVFTTDGFPAGASLNLSNFTPSSAPIALSGNKVVLTRDLNSSDIGKFYGSDITASENGSAGGHLNFICHS